MGNNVGPSTKDGVAGADVLSRLQCVYGKTKGNAVTPARIQQYLAGDHASLSQLQIKTPSSRQPRS